MPILKSYFLIIFLSLISLPIEAKSKDFLFDISKKKSTLTEVILLSLASISPEATSKEFIFQVSNKTRAIMTQLQISENQTDWSSFQNAIVRAGFTATFSWKTPNSGSCQQYIRAHFQGLKWSTPVKVNFCSKEPLIVIFGKSKLVAAEVNALL